MTRTKALVLAAFTLWPIAYMLMFLTFVAGAFIFLSRGGGPAPALFGALFALHILTMLEVLGLLVFYIRHLFMTDAVPQDKKALWAVVLLLGNALAMPVYWYLFVWTEAAGQRRPENE